MACSQTRWQCGCSHETRDRQRYENKRYENSFCSVAVRSSMRSSSRACTLSSPSNCAVCCAVVWSVFSETPFDGGFQKLSTFQCASGQSLQVLIGPYRIFNNAHPSSSRTLSCSPSVTVCSCVALGFRLGLGNRVRVRNRV